MATLPNRRPPRWYSAAIPTSVSLLLTHSLAGEAEFWGPHSWNSWNSAFGISSAILSTSITATIAHRRAASSSSQWTIGNYRRLESSLWRYHWAAARSLYWVRMHISRKTKPTSQKSNFDNGPKWCRRDWNGSISRNNPLGVSIQLLIFPSCHPKRGIDALFRRFGCQEVASFVGPPWIFQLYLGVGEVATISWGGIDVEFEPRGAESRSILPRHVSKNVTACVCDVPIMWNPLHSHISRSKTKSSTFSSTSTSKYHIHRRYTKLPPAIDHRASSQIVYTYSESL